MFDTRERTLLTAWVPCPRFAPSLPEELIGTEGPSTTRSLAIARKYPDRWDQFRRDQVTRLVSRIHHRMNQVDPRMLLSGCRGGGRRFRI